MDWFMRPSGVAYLVVAVVLIGLLVGLPSWAAKSSVNRTQTASAAVPVAPKEQTGLHTPAAHPDAAHTPKHDDALLKRGQQMFGQYCASCHGESGKGDGPGGANLTIKPQLGDRQISEIIVYLRTLATPAYDPAKVLPITAEREGPVQPIFFSHVIHTGSYQIACQYCHAGARRSSDAGLPSVEKCMGCHKIVAAQGNAQVQKLQGYWDEQQPIPWVRIFKIPEYAQFPHKNHIQAGLVCQTCHGRIEAMEQVHAKTGQNPVNDLMNLAAMPVPGPKLTMGWCIECHRAVNEKGVQAVQPSPVAWGAAPRPATADDTKKRNAPVECVACHH